MGGEETEVGYSGGRKDGERLPFFLSINLLVVVFVIIVPKGGNRKNAFFSPPRSLLLFDRFVEVETETEGSGGGRRRKQEMINWIPSWTGIG